MTERTAVAANLTAMLEEETGGTAPPFDDATDLRTGLGLDSVDLVGLIMRVENAYRIRLTHPELSAIATVGELLDLVVTKIDGSTSSAA